MTTVLANHRSAINSNSLLQRISQRIRKAVELSTILEATASEVQQFFECDRVMIYKFQADSSGQVVAEHLGQAKNLPSLQGLCFPADDIPESARQMFMATGVRNVIDVASGQIGQSSLYQKETGEIVEEDLIFRHIDPCHQEYLTTMGVQSSFVVPILNQDKLWGLLVAHHATSMAVLPEQLENIQMVVDQVSIAITQSTLLEQAKNLAQQEATINRIAEQLSSMTALDLQNALTEVVSVLQGSGGRLYLHPRNDNLAAKSNPEVQENLRLYFCGVQPIPHPMSPLSIMEQFYAVQQYFDHNPTSAWAIDNLYKVSALRNLQSLFHETPIQSILIVPLVVCQQQIGYLTIFRNPMQTETLWAGQVDPDARQAYPRQSFQVWKQDTGSQSLPWNSHDIDLAQGIANQFATAIAQADLHQEVQTLNQNLRNLNIGLEAQVEERTAALKQANQQQDVLFKVVAKIRQSLDLATIFKITTTEVREILEADRVAIYRFDPNSGFNDGEIIAEDVTPPFTSVIRKKVHDHCFGERYAEGYRKGWVYAMPDINQAGLKDCFRAVLEEFEIQATLVAPILRNDELWGLFCVHQCAQPRDWQALEIQFITQVVSQVSIALEQANLLNRSQIQATALENVVAELQQTQSQLIQQEKMSSLGRLVAGVAHEINNPVSFIHGNLHHVSVYVKDLLDILRRYQAEYPLPSDDLQAAMLNKDVEFLIGDLPKILSSMEIGTDRIREIVLSLRNFARLDQADLKPVNLHEGIDSTLMILQHRLKGNDDRPDINILKQYGELPLVDCYASSINQVFMSLLNNAIDAIDERCNQLTPILRQEQVNSIEIHTGIHQDEMGIARVSIRIQDNGAGISENTLRNVFDPFFTTKPIGKGTGLGLSIGYQIITEQHHGKLTVTSIVGEGTAFTIDIPMTQPNSDI